MEGFHFGRYINIYIDFTLNHHCTWSDFLIVMKNTVHSGKRNGMMSALGITTGHIVYAS